MQFRVGPYVYKLVVSDRGIFDAEGNELEGCAIESRRLLIISRIVEPDRRHEVALHEFTHAWRFHVPSPSNEEEHADLTATIAEQFNNDLQSQGGREALQRLPLSPVPQLGKPQPASLPRVANETFGRPDRVVCGCCQSETMCGSVNNGPAELHESTKQLRMQRWFVCDNCGGLQMWLESCTSDGVPLGTYVPVPAPRVLHGEAARRWLEDNAALSVAG